MWDPKLTLFLKARKAIQWRAGLMAASSMEIQGLFKHKTQGNKLIRLIVFLQIDLFHRELGAVNIAQSRWRKHL